MLPGLVLAALVVAAACAWTGRLAAVALAVVSVAWLRVNPPMEGVVILPFTPQHGVTAADLAGFAGLAVAAAAFLWPRAASKRNEV